MTPHRVDVAVCSPPARLCSAPNDGPNGLGDLLVHSFFLAPWTFATRPFVNWGMAFCEGGGLLGAATLLRHFPRGGKRSAFFLNPLIVHAHERL